MWQYLIWRQWPASHRDQLRLEPSILVLCVLITGVKKTDDLTENVIRWGYHCLPISLILPLFSLFVLVFLHTSTGCSRMKGTSQPRMNIGLILPDVDEFPYPQDAMPMFVLQVATVEGPWRSCEGAVSSPNSLLHAQHFFLSCFSFCIPSSLFLTRGLTQESSLFWCCSVSARIANMTRCVTIDTSGASISS